MNDIDPTIVVAVIAFLGTATGSIASILASAKATNTKIDALKEQVERHNRVIDRMYAAEKEIAVNTEKIEELQERLKK